MTTRNIMHYIQCELPDGLQTAVVEFEDYFDALVKPYFDDLDAWKKTYLNSVVAELDRHVAVVNGLLEGSPNDKLNSLDSVETNTNLTNPQRNPVDPEQIRRDEIKLGAVGIAMLKGRLFALLKSSRRVKDLRYLWESAGGNYQAFIALGNAIVSGPAGSHIFLEFNPISKNFPLMGKKFDDIFDLSSYHKSLFKYRLFWNGSVGTTAANRNKLEFYGFDDTQITNIFNDLDPNSGYNFALSMSRVSLYQKGLFRLLVLPFSNPARQPIWINELSQMDWTIKEYLDYRFKKSMSSSIIDPSFWISIINTLNEEELRELFDNRPDITDMDVTPSFDTIQGLLDDAMNVSGGNPIINTYLQNIPKADVSDLDVSLLKSIRDTAVELWKVTVQTAAEIRKHTNTPSPMVASSAAVYEAKAKSLEQSIQYLTGDFTPLSLNTKTDAPSLSGDQIKAIFTAPVNIPPSQIKAAIDAIAKKDKTPEELLKAAIKSAVDADAKKQAELGEEAGTVRPDANAPAGGGGSTGGLLSEESLSMLLARRTDWGKLQQGCTAVRQVYATHYNYASGGGDVEAEEETVEPETGEVVGTQPATKMCVLKDGSVVATKPFTQKNCLDSGGKWTSLAAQPFNGSATIDPITGEVTQVANNTGNAEAIPTDSGLLTPADFNLKDHESVDSLGVGPTNTYNGSFHTLCTKSIFDSFAARLNALTSKLEKKLVEIIEMIKGMLAYMQSKIDSYFAAAQAVLDAVLSKLEKLLTIQFNLGGASGFDSSLLKCSWALGFGIKIDLLALLLSMLSSYFPLIGLPITKFLQQLNDFLTKIFCIPVQFIEGLLGNAILNKTLGFLGCTIADIRLPDSILELLRMIQTMFSLRSLTFKTASGEWLDMAFGTSKVGNGFKVLSQFASICHSPPMTHVIDIAVDSLGFETSDLPINKSAEQKSDVLVSAIAMA